MSAQPSSSNIARLLAPAALAACALAVVVVIGASMGGDEESSSGGSPSTDATAQQTTGDATTPKRQRVPATYTIESGDTLGGIAEETGVPIDTIEELNPELDPQALIAGQKIKLRE